MANHTLEFWKIVDGEDVCFRIVGSVSPVVYGRKSGPPDLCYPDEGGEVEFEQVFRDNKEIDISDIPQELLNDLEERFALEVLENEEEDYEDGRANWLLD